MENLTFCRIVTKGQGLGLCQRIEALKSDVREFYNECFVKEREGTVELISTNYKDRAYVLAENVVFCEILARNLVEFKEYQLKNKASWDKSEKRRSIARRFLALCRKKRSVAY